MTGSPDTYAIVWRGPDGVAQPGRATVGPAALRLEGGRGRLSATTLPYREIASARMAAPAERLGRRPTLVLEREDGRDVAVAGVGDAGILAEILEQLQPLVGTAART